MVVYQKLLSTGNNDIIARVNYGSELNVSNSSAESRYGHVVYELHDGTTPMLHTVWTEDLSVNHSEVGYKRWELGVTGGGGGGQSAGRLEPGIEPKLFPAAPNPFQQQTRIRYQTNLTGRVNVQVFDITGRTLRTLQDGTRQPGVYDLIWNGRDRHERRLAQGVYFVRLQTPTCRATIKVVMNR